MSWDVVLMHVPSDITTVEDFPQNFSPELGSRSEVLSTLNRILPDLDLADSAWGILEGKDFSIEFNIGDDDMIDVVMLHVRGNDSAIHAIAYICEHTKWRALDTSTGNFIDFSKNPTEGFRQQKAYADRVIASLKTQSKDI